MKKRYRVNVIINNNKNIMDFFVTSDDSKDLIIENFTKSLSQLFNTKKENIEVELMEVNHE